MSFYYPVQNGNEVKPLKKRIIFIATIFLLSFGIIHYRLASLQLLNSESFGKHQINLLENSVSQRTQTIQIDDGRGHFLDKEGNPLSYDVKNVVILFPFLKYIQWEKEKLANLLAIPVEQIDRQLKEHKEPFALASVGPIELTESKMAAINDWNIPGLIATEKLYPKNHTHAEHLIGVIREDPSQLKSRYPHLSLPASIPIGIEGLQASFDSFVIPEMESRLIYHVDAIGRPLFGLHVKYAGNANPYYPLNIRTTIQTPIQQVAEEILTKHNIKKGGIALIDIASSEVVAMASRPQINQKNPYENNSVRNQVLTPLFPGSVFKTVVLAAALEEGVTSSNESFDCDWNVLGKEKTDDKGLLTLEESFTQSCNFTFGELGERLMEKDASLLTSYATKLGITEHVIWSGDVYHETGFDQWKKTEGQVFADAKLATQPGIVRQTAIGQQDVLVTPLAVANMMATIARGGEKKSVKLVDSIDYKNGSPMYRFSEQTVEKQILSPITISQVQKHLHAVVTSPNGTGNWFNDLPVEIAGKTGTAETGKFTGDAQLYHKWFAGYFPFHQPKYAMVIVNEDVTNAEGGINPIVIDLVNALEE